MIWLALAGLLILACWVYLAVLPLGTGVHGMIGPFPVNGRVVASSPFARFVRLLRGKGANDPPSGITLLGRIHLWGPASDVLICHEFGHLIAAEEMGAWRYLWRYVTDGPFRRAEELRCQVFGVQYASDGLVRIIGERVRR